MPNYGLVINSTYNPISYEQYVAPFMQYAEVYNKIADQYDTLEIEANKWEKLAKSSIDQKEYDQYQSYARKLRAAAEDLAENGLSSRTRSTLSSLRGEYSKTIQPISDAWDLREKEREWQKNARLQNPTIIFSRDASNTGLGAYMTGLPDIQNYSGNLLTEYVKSAVTNIAKAAREDLLQNGKDSKWNKILNGQYWEKEKAKGLTAADVIAAMYDENGNIREDANIYLRTILDDAIAMSGMSKWSNWEDVAPQAYKYASMGLWNAIGESASERLTNRGYIEPDKDTGKNTPTYQLPYGERRSIYLAEHSSVAAKDALNSIAEKDSEGRYKIKDNQKTYTIKGGSVVGTSITGHTQTSDSENTNYNTIMEIYNTFHPESPITKENIQQKINDGTIENFINSNEYQRYANQTASRHSEFIRNFDPDTYGDNLKNIILNGMGSIPLQQMQFGKNDNGSYGYKAKGELTSEELNKKEYKVTGITYGMYGINVLISDGKSVKSYKLPISVNEDMQTMIDATIHGIPMSNGQYSGGIVQLEEKSAQLQAAWEQALANNADSSVLAQLQAEIIRNDQLLKTLYSTLHMQASQLGVVSSTETNNSPVYGPTL